MKRLWKRLGCLRGRHTWVIREVVLTSIDFSGVLGGTYTIHGTGSSPIRCEWCGRER